MRQIIVLMVLAIIIETVFLSFPFTLLLSMVAVMLLGRKSLWLVFLAGISLDLFSLRLLGLDSLIFLLVAAMILRYNRKFQLQSVWYVLSFIFTAVGLYSLYFYQQFFNLLYLLLTLILSVSLMYFLSFSVNYEYTDKKPLAV